MNRLAIFALMLVVGVAASAQTTAPVITSVSPNATYLGTVPSFTMTLSGSGFSSASVIRWNGVDRPTTWINNSTLTMPVQSSDLVDNGLILRVPIITVFNPDTGGGSSSSNPAPFTIYRMLALDTTDLIYEPFTRRLFASASSTAGYGTSNSLITIDPATGDWNSTAPVFVGSDPRKLAVSDNGQYIYAGLSGAAAVRRFDVATRTAGLQFALGNSQYDGPYYVEDMEVLPGAPESVAISLRNLNYSPRHEGVAVFDNGVKRTTQTPGHTGSNSITFGSDAATLFGYNNETTEFGLRRMAVSPAGVVVQSVTGGLINAFYENIEYEAGRIYSSNGKIIDAGSITISAALPLMGISAVRPATDVHRVLFAARVSSTNSDVVQVFDPGTLQSIGTIALDRSLSGSPASFVRWGNDGFAFRTTNTSNQPVLVMGRTVMLNPNVTATGIPAVGWTTPLDGINSNTILVVTGIGFVPGAVVNLNGSERTTTFISASELRADIPASDLLNSAPISITVTNPAPGGTTSSPYPARAAIRPVAPAGLSAAVNYADLNLTWSAGADPNVTYNIYRGSTSGAEILIGSSGSPGYFDSAVTHGVTYYYQVSAVNSAGEGPRSAELTATPDWRPVLNIDNGLAGLVFTKNQVSLVNPGVVDPRNYSVLMKFSVDSTAGWVKLLDFNQGTSDLGLYSYNGYLYFFGWASNLSTLVVRPGETLTLVVTRSLNGPLNVYANGQLILSFNDTGNLLTYPLWVLKDDTTTGGREASSGVLYVLRTYNDVLTPADVSRLSSPAIIPPTALGASAGNAQVSLAWNASSGATSYRIYRGTTSGGETLLISGIAGTTYVDSTVINGTAYYYRVSGVNAGGESAKSNEASATPQGSTNNLDFGVSGLTFAKNQGYLVNPAVSDPTNYSVLVEFSIDSTNGWVKLLDFHQGTSDFGLYSYNGYLWFYGFASNLSTLVFSPGQTVTLIETRGSDGQLKVYADGVLLLSFADTNNALTNPLWVLKDDQVSGGAESSSGVLYKIQSFNGVLTQTEVTNLSGNASLPPGAPSGLAAIGGNAQVSLSWNASSGATSYKIYRGTAPGGETPLASGIAGTTYVDSTVINGTAYYYQASAVNAGGDSARSNEASATPAAGTVNLDFGVSGLVVAKNQGYTVDPGVSDSGNYSVLVKFSIDSTSGWVKLLDFHQGTSDLGLYSYNGYLWFYGFASNLSTLVFSPGQTVTLIQTRGSDHQLKVYTNGVLLLSFADTNNTLTNPLWILADDTVSGGSESSSGVLYKIQTFNGVLTQSQVTTLSQ